ncbi:PaaI family thioesterase [Mycobacterium sp. 236(2023)]|uniref:PaaI family thioesterase n=1 Tax=Mycobacterium sp. 236(2023) TaxID=3038163 RepID=UPI00241546D8|nr:PaaI family thioesterase [Mycobacterium sp. 236(2023)]MDG4666356.1 PaaI family thioesterase [Mycobacterium sp. 236(2023)]
MTDTARTSKSITLPPTDTNGADFPSYQPATASADFASFIDAARRFQDLASSSAPDDDTWRAATEHLDAANALLQPHQAAEGHPPAGRALELPGMGNPLLPAWSITSASPEGVTLHGQFSRFYLGANNIVFGGALPLLFDWTFAIANAAAGRPLSRTGYLHLDYRKPVPITTDLTATGQTTHIDGRKTTLHATLTDLTGSVLAEAETLTIGIHAHNR